MFVDGRPPEIYALYAFLVAAILAFLGARQFARGAAKTSTLFFGIGLLLMVTAFLVWATAGKDFSGNRLIRAPEWTVKSGADGAFRWAGSSPG